MDSLASLFVHYHGDLLYEPQIQYKGGVVDVIPGFDTDEFSFRDLDDFAKSYGYENTDLVYYKKGMDIEDGVKLLYDDSAVREMVAIHLPLGRIDLYVDHYSFDNPFKEMTTSDLLRICYEITN